MSLKLGAEPLVFTFEPHPKVYLGKISTSELLYSEELKDHAFKSLGVQYVLKQKFNDAFKNIEPQFFINEVLIRKLNAVHVVIGDNFKFGKARAGNSTLLQTSLNRSNIGCKVVSDVLSEESTLISSTKIRKALQKGDITTASQLLGYHYLLTGTIIKGNQKGTSFGFPTANIKPTKQLIPKLGVYICYVEILEDDSSYSIFNLSKTLKYYHAICNCGLRPTLTQDKSVTVEAHLIGEKMGNLYGKRL